jgi:S1-C subfamily serine protease
LFAAEILMKELLLILLFCQFFCSFGTKLTVFSKDICCSAKKSIAAAFFSCSILNWEIPKVKANDFSAPAISTIQTAENQVIDLFEKTTPSVVYINTFTEKIDAFSMNILKVPSGTGTGFVWDDKGHIVTNFHVIQNSKSAKVTVTGDDGKSTKTYKAEVTGVDPDKDVAVLQITNPRAGPWKPIKLGFSNNLRVGQSALAIGFDFIFRNDEIQC